MLVEYTEHWFNIDSDKLILFIWTTGYCFQWCHLTYTPGGGGQKKRKKIDFLPQTLNFKSPFLYNPRSDSFDIVLDQIVYKFNILKVYIIMRKIQLVARSPSFYEWLLGSNSKLQIYLEELIVSYIKVQRFQIAKIQ